MVNGSETIFEQTFQWSAKTNQLMSRDPVYFSPSTNSDLKFQKKSYFFMFWDF